MKHETKAERLWHDRHSAYEAAKAALAATRGSDEDCDREADNLADATLALLVTPCPDRTAMIVKLDALERELNWFGTLDGDIAGPVIDEAKRFLATEPDPGQCRLAA
jgi:hypothetical protein